MTRHSLSSSSTTGTIVKIAVTGASRGFGRAIALALCRVDNNNHYHHHAPNHPSGTGNGTTHESHSSTNVIQQQQQQQQNDTFRVHTAVFIARSDIGLQELTQEIILNHHHCQHRDRTTTSTSTNTGTNTTTSSTSTNVQQNTSTTTNSNKSCHTVSETATTTETTVIHHPPPPPPQVPTKVPVAHTSSKTATITNTVTTDTSTDRDGDVSVAVVVVEPLLSKQNTTTATTTKTTIATPPPNIRISQISADLGNIDTIDEIIDTMLQCWDETTVTTTTTTTSGIRGCTSTLNEEKEEQAQAPPTSEDFVNDIVHDACFDDAEVERYILINNVGSLGHIGDCDSYPSIHEMHNAITLNVTNALWTTTRIVQWAKQRCSSNISGDTTTNTTKKRMHVTIVNVSSLVAKQAFPSLATYSAGKAARDSYHTALAKEVNLDVDEGMTTTIPTNYEQQQLQIRILNYAPGPLQGTDMTSELQTNVHQLHSSIRGAYTTTISSGTGSTTNQSSNLIDPNASADVLRKLLLDDTYVNGAHIDYYDCI